MAKKVKYVGNIPYSKSRKFEFKGLKISLVAGTTKDTNIAIADMVTTDSILSCIEFDGSTPVVLTDRTAKVAITSDGNIQSDYDSSGFKLLVIWQDLEV